MIRTQLFFLHSSTLSLSLSLPLTLSHLNMSARLRLANKVTIVTGAGSYVSCFALSRDQPRSLLLVPASCVLY